MNRFKYIVPLLGIMMASFLNTRGQPFNMGMGGLYGFRQDGGGLDLRFGWQGPQALRLTGNFGFYFPYRTQNAVFQSRIGWGSMNVNIHYNHHFTPAFQLSPFIGYNYTMVDVNSRSTTYIKREYKSESNHYYAGLNLGTSVFYDLGRFVPFAEGKYVLTGNPDFNQTVITFGFIVEFGQTGKGTYNDADSD